MALAILMALLSTALAAIDKNGVAPHAISLPAGPGSIQGLGESFQPQLNSGSGGTAVPILLPRGSGGFGPELSLCYNSGAGNGAVGLGWSLTDLPSIQRNTDRGVPFHVDGPNGVDDDYDGQIDNADEVDTFTGAGGEELVPLDDGSFRSENESNFHRYVRSGDGWEAQCRDGRRLFFGRSSGARVEDSGRIFQWCLERQIDANDNAIDYEYLSDPATPAQKYLRRIRWGQPSAFFAVVFHYENGRPDATTSYRSGFELQTTLRLSCIDVISQGIPASPVAIRVDCDADGWLDALIRRYRLEYAAGEHLSLLSKVTQVGADGVTALPSVTYSYSSWTPPDNVAADLIRSRDAPVEGFDSPSVELIDMNGDGLPDLLLTSGSQHRVALNRGQDAEGRLVWAPARSIPSAPTIDIASDRVSLADATADGLADLLVQASNTTFLCFANSGDISWSASPLPLRNTDTWPIWPSDGDGGRLSRSVDLDYNRANDVLHTSATGLQLWMLLPSGRYARERRLPPLLCAEKVFRFDLPGTHIADMNGDRLQDLVWVQASRVVYFPNRGRGDFEAPILLSIDWTLTSGEIERSGFSDIDGDGLADLTIVGPEFAPTSIAYWVNRFHHGLQGPRSILGLPAPRAPDALRWADMNANGTVDIAFSRSDGAPGEKILVLELAPSGKPHLLVSVDNGLGLRTSLHHESAAAQMVRAQNAGMPWRSRMPLAVTVVSRIVEDDGLGNVSEQRLTYRDPYYDPRKQEFRGFAGAETLQTGDDTIAGLVSRSVFDTGAATTCLKGRLLELALLGEDGKLFKRIVNTWSKHELATGPDGRKVSFASHDATDEFLHEGETVPVHVRSETDHDGYGNTTAERRLGVVDRGGDEVFVERTHELRLGDWRLDLLARETTRDAAGNRLAEQRLSHDARGNLEQVEAWLDLEDRWIVVQRQRFDAHGNVIEAIDARGNRRTTTFDSLLHLAPVAETIDLVHGELVMTAQYDLGLGVVTSVVDFHGQRTEFHQDALGRLQDVRRPGGAGESHEYLPGAPISCIIRRAREDDSGATLDSHLYFDARGQPLGSSIEGENGQWRFLQARTYNARQLVARAWLPQLREAPQYTAPTVNEPHELKLYDAQGRLTESLKPEGSRTRTEHLPLATAIQDGNDLEGHGGPDIWRLDGLGRLVAVEEKNGSECHRTTYSWNARGELEGIVDALENTRIFRFDSLGRLVLVDDPDRGLLRFTHDDGGNRVRREDAKGQVVTQAFDATNRILEKIHVGGGEGGADRVIAAYHHDQGAGMLDFGDGTSGVARHTLGRLAWVKDASGEEHFSYDERGNIEWILRRVLDSTSGLLVSYRIQRDWDLLDREVAVTFPDNDRLEYVHGAGFLVVRVQGGSGGAVIVENIDHTPGGHPRRLRLGNGIEETFELDSSQRLHRARLTDAQGGELRHEQFAYDAASNLAAIADLRPFSGIAADSPRRTTASFFHDELHRLTRFVHGDPAGGGRIDYVHDALGNLLSQTTPPPSEPGHLADPQVNLGVVTHAGGRSRRQGRRPGDLPGPHALTGSAHGLRLHYDANGNVTAVDDATLAWDCEDQLIGFSKFGVEAVQVHSHDNRRVVKRVARGRSTAETIYLDAACEIQNGAVVKYAFLDQRRLARIRGSLDSTRDRVQRLRLAPGWNLVAAAVESSASLREVFGADSAVYDLRGSSHSVVDTTAPIPAGRPLWVHVAASRVAYLRGRLVAVAPGEISPGPFHAWPRLDPFQPARMLAGSAPVLVYDAAKESWLRNEPLLPAFLSEAREELDPAQAFWSPQPLLISAEAAEPTAVIYYHLDALSSVAVITDATGALLEERTHYPFGGIRHQQRQARPVGGVDHDFASRERDEESGFIALGRRSYVDTAGVFLSPDPRYAALAELARGTAADRKSFAAVLSNPQQGNLYGYALRNPLQLADPSELEVVFQSSRTSHPLFEDAMKAFRHSSEGKRILKSIADSGARVSLGLETREKEVGLLTASRAIQPPHGACATHPSSSADGSAPHTPPGAGGAAPPLKR